MKKRLFFLFLFVLTGIMPELAQSQEQESETTQKKYIGPITYKTKNTGAGKLLPDISIIGSLAGAIYNDDPQGDQGHDPGRTGFTLQEIEMALQSNVDPYFRADVFLGFSEDGVEVEEGYAATTALLKGLEIKAGKFLLPFGRHNVKHLEKWDFADNMLPNKALLGIEGLGELGLEFAYIFPLTIFLQAQGTVTNGTNDVNFNGNRNQDLLYNARLSTSVDLGPNTTLLLGASGAWGFNDTAAGMNTQLYGGDLLVKWKPGSRKGITWQSEYIYRKRDEPGSSRHDGGLYSFIDYQFAQRWHGGLRYDQVGLPEDLVTGRYRLTPTITFNPTEFSRLRLQYEYDKTQNLKAVHATLLQLEYSMGPHGAHPF